MAATRTAYGFEAYTAKMRELREARLKLNENSLGQAIAFIPEDVVAAYKAEYEQRRSTMQENETRWKNDKFPGP